MIGSRPAWLVLAALMASTVSAQAPLSNAGPYNARFLEGGIGIDRALPADAPILSAGAAFSYSAWLRPAAPQPGFVTLIAVGDRRPALKPRR